MIGHLGNLIHGHGVSKFASGLCREDSSPHPQEATIRMLEIHDGCPVVGFIFNKSTCRTGRKGRKIILRVHGEVESGEKSDYRDETASYLGD